jgi:hypothetical protein
MLIACLRAAVTYAGLPNAHDGKRQHLRVVAAHVCSFFPVEATYSVAIRMISSYRNKGLGRFAETGSKAGIQAKHPPRLRRLLTALDVASRPEDMNAPGNDQHR